MVSLVEAIGNAQGNILQEAKILATHFCAFELGLRGALLPNLSYIQVTNSTIFHDVFDKWQMEKGSMQVESKIIQGGITNRLVRVGVRSVNGDNSGQNGTEPQAKFVLCRFLGSSIVDRYKESLTLNFLIHHKIGKRIFVRSATAYSCIPPFQLEEWIAGKSLSLYEMRSLDDVRISIAKQIAHLHSVPLSDLQVNGICRSDDEIKSKIGSLLAQNYVVKDTAAANSVHMISQQEGLSGGVMSSCIWGMIQKWLTMSKTKNLLASEGVDLEVVEKTFKNVRSIAIEIQSPLVFSHNDLLNGNILRKDSDGELCFIDFEYSGVAERGFDVANHFCEWCGFECDWSLYPSVGEQLQFIRVYLDEIERIRMAAVKDNGSIKVVNENKIVKMAEEVKIFALVSHAFWGTWAAVQSANEIHNGFDYKGYSVKRLKSILDPAFINRK